MQASALSGRQSLAIKWKKAGEKSSHSTTAGLLNIIILYNLSLLDASQHSEAWKSFNLVHTSYNNFFQE